VHQIDLGLIDRQGAAVTNFAAIYRLMANQKFPSPFRLGPRAVAWRRADLDKWSEARPIVVH
jgi:predicted DNA-binding transcriptional regulator AlpA